jgi:hypothetical protein
VPILPQLLGNGAEAFLPVTEFVNMAPFVEHGKRFGGPPRGHMLNGLLQVCILLCHDLVQPKCSHSCVLQLREDAAGLNSLVLPRIAD